jgi:hypothetical protein
METGLLYFDPVMGWTVDSGPIGIQVDPKQALWLTQTTAKTLKEFVHFTLTPEIFAKIHIN